jgi:flagellar protein FliO/FliZ
MDQGQKGAILPGTSMQALTFFFAFVAVLALIGLAAWLVRRFAGNRLGANTTRGRMPRLAVIDAAAVDGRRRLVLVRRDNIEHLLMIGGPSDIVVESNIVRALPGRDQLPQRAPIGAESRIAPVPVPEPGWTEGEGHRSNGHDHGEPQMTEPPLRAPRPAFADEVRRPAPERRSDPLAAFSPEPLGNPLSGRPEPRPELRGEPMPSRVTSRNESPLRAGRPSDVLKAPPIRAPERPAAPPPAPAMSAADQNLAEMAQRLEAALRRPGAEPSEPRIGAPSVAPESPANRAPARNEQPAAPPAAPPSPKSGFENLEDEMASLLGRPKTPS